MIELTIVFRIDLCDTLMKNKIASKIDRDKSTCEYTTIFSSDFKLLIDELVFDSLLRCKCLGGHCYGWLDIKLRLIYIDDL